MSDTVISVEVLSKRYRLGLKPKPRNFGEALINGLKRPFQPFASRGEGETGEFWALKDVSFEIKRGDVVGIIGRNGAGKSTLLKILSHITPPTSGQIAHHGRVASLLEVGTGFHPELTGRENIYLNGAILGMRRTEIRRKFDEIVAFSEVEQFLDTPVKRYSSGMYVRLAFAVAAHLEPEILIVDEVLAVGDAEFQKKCLGKMQEVSTQGGRTVLFVSHNMAAVRKLCERVIVLANGRTAFIGTASDGVSAYSSGGDTNPELSWSMKDAPGNEHIRLLHISVAPCSGENIDVASGFVLRWRFHSTKENANLDNTLEVRTQDDVLIFHEGQAFTCGRDSRDGIYETAVTIPGMLLNAGKYRVGLIFGQEMTHLLLRLDDVLMFAIEYKAVNDRMTPTPALLRTELSFVSRIVNDGVA